MENKNARLPEGGAFLNEISYSFDVSVCALYEALSRGMTLWTADRQTLEALYLEGDRVQDIADQIGVHVATVYKELKRGETGGLDRNMRREYSATLAQRRLAENFKRRGRKTDEADRSDLAEAVKV